jgi:uncharacterized protein (TIGR03382 family)
MRRVGILAAIAALTAPSAALAGGRDDRLGEVRVPPEPGVAFHDDHVSKILFLNRCQGGCVLEPGRSDARENTSSIVDGTSYVSEFEHSEETWQAVVQCVKEVYAPYDVQITDVDPGTAVFHHEAIVAGDWDEIGYDRPVGGVAPSQCVPANNVISFTFANGYGPDPIRICAVVAQETAHSYGLEHAFDCSDPMTYLQSCGRQFFRDRDTPCGEFEERECLCGGSAQNSHRWLKTVLGENPVPVPGPDTEITAPIDGAAVEGSFGISVTASHMRGVGHVDLYINGTMYERREGHPVAQQSQPYDFVIPDDLPDGVMDIEIRAYNDIESETVEMVTVTRGEPCQSADQCNDGQQCEDGRCFFPPAVLEMGDECAADAECVSGLCPMSGDESYCSDWCFPTTVGSSCPDGFDCLEVGPNQGVCWPASGGGGGGGICSTGGTNGPATVSLIGLALLVAVRRRR